MRILLVEDDNMIGQSLKQALSENGLAVDWVKDGVLAQDALAQGGYAAVLLDLGLPRRSGLEVLRRARQEGDRTPMLVLTARDGVDDRVQGLDFGADDYMVKPFELRELLARMRAIIRRFGGHAQSVIGTSETQLDLSSRELTHGGTTLLLSAKEFRLMHALLERPGAILSRSQLEERLYGWDEEVSSNAVEVLIHGVRRKLGQDVIRNVRGLGWRVSKEFDVTSLKHQLMAWLLPLYAVAATVAAVIVYYIYGSMVAYFMDNQLRVFADSHAVASGPTPAFRPLSRYNVVHKGDMIVQIWDREHRLVTSSWPELALSRQTTQGFHDVTIGNARWRVYTLQSPDRTVQSAQSLAFRRHIVKTQALQAGLPVALMIPISGIFLWFGMRPALRRLELISQAAARQNEHRLGELPVEHAPCEIQPLVLAVNTLLARLRDAFASQRRFVQDAAHELRTPITAMSLQLENLKTRMPDANAAEQLSQLEAGLARTRRLVEQLLRLARQESPRTADAPVPIQLDAILKSSIADFMPLADRRKIDLGYAADIDATVRANEDELRSLVHNLLDNALRYTPEGGIVDVTLHQDTGVATVEIADNGPGIPPDLLPRVCDRFFRIEDAETEGSGLGLAIAKNAAERNRIGLDLVNRTDGSGLIARLRFDTATVSPQPKTADDTIPTTPVATDI